MVNRISFVGALGLGLSIAGVIARWVVFPSIYEGAIEENMRFGDENSPGYRQWAGLDLKATTLKKFMIFNITNPKDVRNGGKAVLEEIGPFAYRKTDVKSRIHKEGVEKLSYGLTRSFEFDPDASCAGCAKDTKVTIINMGLQGVLDKIMSLPPAIVPFLLPSIEKAITSEKYKDEAIHEGLKVNDLLFSKFSPGVLRYLADNFPQLGVEANISVFPQTSSSWFSINTGAVTWERYGQVEKYQGSEVLPEDFWPEFGPTPSAHKAGAKGECRRIRGTDGALQMPGFDKQEAWNFNVDLCRSLTLERDGEGEVQGIKTDRYIMPESVLDSSLPENHCFCLFAPQCVEESLEEDDTWDFSKCEQLCPKGTINLRGCKNGQPVISSKPHFFQGDPSLLEAVVGLKPDPALHETVVQLEPRTGRSLAGHIRMQVSFPLMNEPLLSTLAKVNSTQAFPILWFEETTEIDEEGAKMLKSLLDLPVTVTSAISGAAIGIGLAAFITSIFFWGKSKTTWS